MRLSEAQKQAIDVLIQCGLLKKFNEPLYHGRASAPDEVNHWQVDPQFNNAGNLTGHHNTNKISALNTGTQAIAEKYAHRRTRGIANSQAEIYSIQSTDPEALILNGNFDPNDLDPEHKVAAIKAIRATLEMTNVTNFAPVAFADRYYAQSILTEIDASCRRANASTPDRVLFDDAAMLRSRQKFAGHEKLFDELCQAHNSRALLQLAPSYLIDRFIDAKNQCSYNHHQLTHSNQFVAAWLAHNHIVGVARQVASQNISTDFTATQLFDLNKINTEKVVGERQMYLQSLYNPIANLTRNFCANQQTLDILSTADTQTTLTYMTNTYQIQPYLNLDAGVWEGFKVGEHTETALRIFDKDFSEEVPPQLLPLIRTALISHDIGKGVAVNHQQKNQQAGYNRFYATKLYERMHIPANLQNLLLFIIGDAQKLASEYYVKKDASSKTLLHRAAEKELSAILRQGNVNDDLVRGLVRICEIVQTCDSGAYTTRATTRGHSNDAAQDIYYHNANTEFEQNFTPATNLTGDALTQMKGPHDRGLSQ